MSGEGGYTKVPPVLSTWRAPAMPPIQNAGSSDMVRSSLVIRKYGARARGCRRRTAGRARRPSGKRCCPRCRRRTRRRPGDTSRSTAASSAWSGASGASAWERSSSIGRAHDRPTVSSSQIERRYGALSRRSSPALPWASPGRAAVRFLTKSRCRNRRTPMSSWASLVLSMWASSGGVASVLIGVTRAPIRKAA